MATPADINVPDAPKKGASWDQWLKWVLAVVTALASAYAAWKSDETATKILPLVAAQVQTK